VPPGPLRQTVILALILPRRRGPRRVVYRAPAPGPPRLIWRRRHTRDVALIQALEEAVRSGDEEKIREAEKELRRWLDWFGPRNFGLAVQDIWIAAPPERRREIEEMARALESVHPEAAQWAQYYIERVKRAEAEGLL